MPSKKVTIYDNYVPGEGLMEQRFMDQGYNRTMVSRDLINAQGVYSDKIAKGKNASIVRYKEGYGSSKGTRYHVFWK